MIDFIVTFGAGCLAGILIVFVASLVIMLHLINIAKPDPGEQ